MSRKLLAYGIFMWASEERRSNRYGAIYLGSDTYAVVGISTPTFDDKLADSLRGKRVKLTAEVVEARDSGHVGDLFLGITPSRPEVGETIELGVGTLDLGAVSWANAVTIVLKPGDGRTELWFDPHKLYRLHDQTVNLFAELTSEDFSERATCQDKIDSKALVSAGDGYIQAKATEIPPTLPNAVERIGDGMFVVVPPGYGPVGSKIE